MSLGRLFQRYEAAAKKALALNGGSTVDTTLIKACFLVPLGEVSDYTVVGRNFKTYNLKIIIRCYAMYCFEAHNQTPYHLLL